MAEVTILHNPRCSTSRAAVEAGEASGLDVEVRNYLKEPLTEREWADLIASYDGDPTDLVRRDPNFTRAGLTDADVATPEQVARVLADNAILAQRPVLVRGGRVIIGRPKTAVAPFLA